MFGVPALVGMTNCCSSCLLCTTLCRLLLFWLFDEKDETAMKSVEEILALLGSGVCKPRAVSQVMSRLVTWCGCHPASGSLFVTRSNIPISLHTMLMHDLISKRNACTSTDVRSSLFSEIAATVVRVLFFISCGMWRRQRGGKRETFD